MNEELIELIQQATLARNRAHCLYSQFAVGVALQSQSGGVYLGCNVENASLGLTMCAERVAVGSAIVAGDKDWRRIVLVSKEAITPCGACRQVLAEFAPKLEIVLVDSTTGRFVRSHFLDALLPARFENFKD